MASDFFLEAMQNLSECLFTTPPFDLLPTANEETAHIVPKPSTTRNVSRSERRTRPHPSQALKCPRCDSVNTKFCYYNNYNLSQPRHFCKSCRRYWTNGGVLRNIPVGGGSRKNKKSSSNIKKPSQPSKSSESYHPTALMSLHNSASSSLYNSTSSSPTSSSSSSVMPDVDLRCIAEFNEIRRFSQGFSEFKTNNIVSSLEEICVNQHQQEVIQNSADIRETMRNSNSTDLQEMIQNSADLREIMQNSADLQHLSSMPLGSMISGSNFSGDVQGKFHNVDEISASPAFPYGLENSSLNEINLPEFQSGSYNFESLLDEWIHCNADFKAQHCWPEPGPVYLP